MLYVAAMFVHIYMGTIGVEGAFEAMADGNVDVNWAKERHSLWYEEEMQAGAGQRPGDAAGRITGISIRDKNARPCGRAFCYKGAMRIIGLAGWSGSGKTTLIKKLIPRLIARGISVSTLKHAHHGFDLDQPGKDSFFHRTAGATEVIISSAKRWAILHELREQPEWDMAALVGKMSPVDLVLVEGFKRDAFPKLEIHRIANGKPLIHPEDPHIVAVASDSALPAARVPVIDLNDIEAIADLLLKHAVPIGAGRIRERLMAQLTDDCFAFSGPLLPLEDMERLIGERVAPVAETERVALARRARPRDRRRREGAGRSAAVR